MLRSHGRIDSHGFTKDIKRRVFDALFERQLGRCLICGISQAEIYEEYQSQFEEYRHYAETLPAEEHRQWYLTKVEQGPAPVYRKLQIDHCHETGMIRGLLCGPCNSLLALVENYGLFQHYSAPAYQYRPLDRNQKRLVALLRRWGCDDWLNQHRDSLLLYMNQDRWLPRQDILFHLQRE